MRAFYQVRKGRNNVGELPGWEAVPRCKVTCQWLWRQATIRRPKEGRQAVQQACAHDGRHMTVYHCTNN